MREYLTAAFTGAKPLIGTAIGAVQWVLFPDKAFVMAAGVLGGAMLLDIVTKYVALSRASGGYRNAVKTCRIRSDALWSGTKNKLYTYLVIAILAGLSYRLIWLAEAGVFLASTVYLVLFLRETQSIIENLIQGGSDLGWLNDWLKHKQEQILENEDAKIESGKNGGGNNDTEI